MAHKPVLSLDWCFRIDIIGGVVPSEKNRPSEWVFELSSGYTPGRDNLVDGRQVVVSQSSDEGLMEFVREGTLIISVEDSQPSEVTKFCDRNVALSSH
jgi:hypothetical protein